MSQPKHRINIVRLKACPLKVRQTAAMLRRLLQEENQTAPWHITLIFTDDLRITDLNRQFFAKDRPTDVISFDLSDDERHREGEIYISVDTAMANASQYGVTWENELCRLAVHGVLHLVGYDDATDDQRRMMTERENKALENIGSSL